MSKAGKNTPQSVLRYIDAHLPVDEPDPVALARELSYNEQAIRTLQERHGDGLLAYLEKQRRDKIETPLFLAVQQGQRHPQQYVSSPHGAIDGAEAVPNHFQRELNKRAHQERQRQAADVIAAAQDVLAAVQERAEASPDFKRSSRLLRHRIRREVDRFIERERRKAA